MPDADYLTLIPLPDALRSSRLTIRPFTPDDAPALYATIVASRDHLGRFLPWPGEHTSVDYTTDLIIRFQAQWLLREKMTCGIFLREDGVLLGGIGLHPHDWTVRSFEIGYWLAREAEGHGYMSEAVRLLTDYAFESLAARRVEIRCDARNGRSAAVARRLGFPHEARLRNNRRGADGHLRDTLVFALTDSDPRWT